MGENKMTMCSNSLVNICRFVDGKASFYEEICKAWEKVLNLQR